MSFPAFYSLQFLPLHIDAAFSSPAFSCLAFSASPRPPVPMDTPMLLTETPRIMMIVVWICDYPAFVVIRVPVDNDTTKFEFARMFAFYQTGGPSLSYATVCSRSGCFSPLSRAVGVSWSYSYTSNSISTLSVNMQTTL